MELHPEFVKAGKKPGLQVWRVEQMDLTPVPCELHGEFFTGDAYVLLYTTEAHSYNVHSWRGKEATQDEIAAAAIFVSQLDSHLGGAAVQFQESQNFEPTTFFSYFKHGVRYKEGGVATGFKHVVTNDSESRRLLHVKGRRCIRATEVEMKWESFNKGDGFIIDLGKVIYHWSGCECNPFERLKTTEVAKDIRDNERRGRADVIMIDEGEEPEEVIELLGPKPDLPSAIPDGTADKDCTNKASLYLISDAAGSMNTTLVAEQNPFKQDMLCMKECYILDNGKDGNIFVWKGKEANPDERKAALTAANQFIKEKNYCPSTPVQVLPAGAESTLFKQFYVDWMDKDESVGLGQAYTTNNIAKVEQIPFDASSLHGNNTMAAQHGMVDDGSGTVEIWRVEGSEKVEVDPSSYGQFFGGDCYLILYTYKDQCSDKYIIYTWQGNDCEKFELGASAFFTVALDGSIYGKATQVRVTQGKEPPHLVSLFKNNPLVIHLGGTCREHGDSEPGSTRLYHIRQSSTKATRAVEVEPSASSLNSNDIFVLKTPTCLYVWIGKGAKEGGEEDAADYVASLIGGSPTVMKETEEPDAFWAALGGKQYYQTSTTLQNYVNCPRLFACSNKTGRLIAEEVPGEITQLDLAPDDVMILDATDQIFVWIGEDANETEKKGCMKIAEGYLNSDPSGRRDLPITTIKQGEEPPTFTGWFHAWESDMWDKTFSECKHHGKHSYEQQQEAA